MWHSWRFDNPITPSRVEFSYQHSCPHSWKRTKCRERQHLQELPSFKHSWIIPLVGPLILLNVSFSLHTLPQGPRLYSFGLHWWSGAWWEPAWRTWPVLLISSVFHKTSVRMVMYWRLTVIQVSIKRSLGRYRVYLGSVFPCDYTSQLQSGCCAQHLFSSGVPCWQFPSR